MGRLPCVGVLTNQDSLPRNREEADLFFCSVTPLQKCETRTKSTGVRYAKGRRPNNTGDWQLGKSPLWKCFWSRKSKWAGTRKREEESVSVPTALRHPRQPPSRTRRDGC